MPTLGQTLLYKITDADLGNLDQQSRGPRRNRMNQIAPPQVGDVLPLIVTTVIPPDMVSGQVFLNGGDMLWVAEVHPGTEPGQYVELA